MNTTRITAAAGMVLFASAAPLHAQTYAVVDLGSLSGWTQASAVNDDRIVVGSSLTPEVQYRGFVWDGSLASIEPLPPETQTEATDVNALARAVCAAYSMGEVSARALLIDGASTTELGAFLPRAIADNGLVVGARDTVNANGLVVTQAVVCWGPGSLSALPQLGAGTSATALDIADNNDVVGSAFALDALTPTAVLWRNGAVIDLGTLGGPFAQANAISPSGGFVGGSSATDSAPLHAFRYTLAPDASVTQRLDLGTIAGGWSVAYDTNDVGDVVGTSDGHAFLYAGGSQVDLNGEIGSGLGWTLIGATGINSNGDIVGWGDHGADGLRAFLLVRPCNAADITTLGAAVGDPGYGVPDGRLTAADIQYYVNLYVALDPAADLTTTGAAIGDPGYGVPDGAVTAADIQFYVNLFVEGCP